MAFVAPPLSAILMTINPWIPCILATGMYLLAFLIGFILPETVDYYHPSLKKPRKDQQPNHDTIESFAAGPPTDPAPSIAPNATTFVPRWHTSIKRAVGFLGHDWRVAVLLLPFMVAMVMLLANTLLLQYASVRYNMTISRATLIISIRAGFMALGFLVLVPGASHVMMVRLGYDGKRKDLYLARASMIVLCLGWCLTAFAPTLGIFIVAQLITTLGSGQAMLVRSFMTDLVKSHDVGKLYTIIGMLDTIGLMTAGPVLAGLFDIGLDIGGAAIGLPFWLMGGLYAFNTGLLFIVRIRKRDGQIDQGQGEASGRDSATAERSPHVDAE